MEISNLQIPNKSHFKANEVCSLTGVKPYVLRFWESEFSQINPMSSSSGQKLYEHGDIEFIAKIKYLLFDEKMTIEKAKQELETTFLQNELEVEKAEGLLENQAMRRQELTDSEIQKLVLAKAKLSSILNFTQSIRNREKLH